MNFDFNDSNAIFCCSASFGVLFDSHRSPMRLFCMNILIVSSLNERFELPFIKLFLLAKRFVKYIEQFILQFNSVLVLLLQWHIRQHNTYVLFGDETIPIKFVELVHETH
jgi:uncharacterized protein (DUF1919 family)